MSATAEEHGSRQMSPEEKGPDQGGPFDSKGSPNHDFSQADSFGYCSIPSSFSTTGGTERMTPPGSLPAAGNVGGLGSMLLGLAGDAVSSLNNLASLGGGSTSLGPGTTGGGSATGSLGGSEDSGAPGGGDDSPPRSREGLGGIGPPSSFGGAFGNSPIGGPTVNSGATPSEHGSIASGTTGNSQRSVSRTICPICTEKYNQPKVLACFHTFCKPCLDRLVDSPGKIICPTCHAETQLCPELGVDSLLTDYAVANLQDALALERKPGAGNLLCTGCKSKDLSAVAYCADCSNFLCNNCVMAHQYMHCFEGHEVKSLQEMDVKSLERPAKCLQHKSEALKFFCFTCNLPICATCTQTEHPRGVHFFEPIQDVGKGQLDLMRDLLEQAKVKQRSLCQTFKGVDQAGYRLHLSFQKAEQAIAETTGLLLQAVEEQRLLATRELENVYTTKQMALALMDKKMQSTMEKLTQTIDFTDRLLSNATPAEVLVFKKLLETRLQAILNYNPDIKLQTHVELDFVTNMQQARLALANTFGQVRGGTPDILAGHGLAAAPGPTPIGRPASGMSTGGAHGPPGAPPALPFPSGPGNFSSLMLNGPDVGPGGPPGGGFPGGPGGAFGSSGPGDASSNYERWSNGGSDIYGGSSSGTPGPMHGGLNPNSQPFYPSTMSINTATGLGQGSPSPVGAPGAGDPQIVELTNRLMGATTGGAPPTMGSASGPSASLAGVFPPKSNIKRHKMIYHCKFGEFGVADGQFTEPSGVAVNANGDIIVADTNNHRVQVFDREGRFRFQFGECGKRDGQLLYPNRVAVNRTTGDIVVTERSPTHQVQVYSGQGKFLRKFGANILQHPRGVCVDTQSRIVIVECKVMRVLILDMYGNVLQKFGCSRYLEFPNGVVTNDKQEIFISDNRAHCIKVFNYEGQYVRQVGGEGITNYPIGVGINHLGEIVVADNHNNFNITIFSPDGTLMNALESKVKHAQCFDVALTDDGSIVLASKDYRLYVYRYVHSPIQPSMA